MAQEQQIQQELRRQRLLGELGLTAWVAQTQLEGAISSQVLGVKPSQAPAVAPAPTAAAQTAAQPATTTGTESPLAAVRQGLSSTKKTPPPEPLAKPKEAAPTPELSAPQGQPQRFTLHAYAMSFGYLLVEQQDPKAPGFTRQEQQLLKNLAALWGGLPARPLVFQCPPSPQPVFEAEAKELLGGFVGGLEDSSQAPHNKTLIVATEQLATLLVEQRHQAQQQRLAISSLAEMLADPLAHKPISWQAMLEAEFYAKAQH